MRLPWMRKPTFKKKSVLSYTIVTVIGAVALGIASFLLDPKPDSLNRVIASSFVGGVLGWMYELAKDLYELATELKKEAATLIEVSQNRLEDVCKYLDYQEKPLKMLLRAKNHAGTMGTLLTASLNDKFRHIAYVYENQYLTYLNSAIEESDCFEGVNRQIIRWFRDTPSGASYLQRLRDKKMNEKLRIFIIDDEDETKMNEDLANQDLMDFYWSNTGKDVQTYWVSKASLRKTYVPNVDIPDDFALYDKSFLIRYDPVYRTLTFDLIEAGYRYPESVIFSKLKEQLELKQVNPFIKIEPSNIKIEPSKS